MKHKLADILDIPRLQSALDSLYIASKIPSAIIDNDGTIHTGSGWQDVCTKFHRVHPEAQKRCIESDQYICRHIYEANPSVTYKCPHGLVDAAIPIIIEGEHLGNVFTGQLLFEEPDLDAFRSQAKAYGFDEEKYIDAVKKVPIVSERAMQENLAFIAHLTGMIAEIGLKHAREKGAEWWLKESERRYGALFEHMQEGFAFCKMILENGEPVDFVYLSVNEAFKTLTGLKSVVGKRVSEIIPGLRASDPGLFEIYGRVAATGYPEKFEMFVEALQQWFSVSVYCPEQGYFVAVFDVITDRKRSEEIARRETSLRNVLLDHLPCIALVMKKQTREIVACNELAKSHGAVIGKRCNDTLAVPGVACPFCLAPEVWETGKSRQIEVEYMGRFWQGIWVPFSEDLYVHYIFDITDRKRTEAEKEKLQGQLQQAMKMEAVGRLAGGVAHDFNNLLTAIIGNVSLAQSKLSPSDPVMGVLMETNKAADRAAALVKQLLAFSRKQIIEPKVLNLNSLIADLNAMLVRLIREDIRIQFLPGNNLGAVKVDPGHFQQILVNLVVNARDAMAGSGEILIETSNVDLDDGYCAGRSYLKPGRFVMITVSDTGHGMSEEVKAHIFEPFFTTKGKGRGTGLGLATTYGAVKQAGGSIEVYSEVGIGTTFKIFLPRVEGEASRQAIGSQPHSFSGGTETVLLVEDDDIVRNLCVRVLEELGYRVLRASNGTEAIALSRKHGDRIDLLMTDVVMPGMNGGELATQLILHHPEMKILFTSGYTEDVIVHHGVLDDGVSFIGKPYSPTALAMKIREVLEKA